MSIDLQQVLHTFKEDCDWLGLRWVREKIQQRKVRDLHPEANDTRLDQGLMMEVVCHGQLAYSATSDLSPSGLRRCFARGKALAAESAKHQLLPFDPSGRGEAQAVYQGPAQRPLNQAELSDIVGDMMAAAEALDSSPNRLSSAVYLWLIETSSHYLTSAGADIAQSFDYVSQTLELTGSKDNVVQTRTDGGSYARGTQAGLESFTRDDLLIRADKVARELNELLVAEDCPTGKYDLLLTPSQMMLQIHESIGHPLELDRILGDERNYAGWSFVKPEDFGVLQYGSALMNVVFDPDFPGGFASYAFDDTAIPAKRVHLIKDGILQVGLGSAESQKRLGLPGVANARAQSWNRPPIDRMANINLEPGQQSLAQMVAQVERGVLMDANRSWSIDDYRNKFQFGCEYGRMIENGKLTHVVKNPNYRGISVPFWRSLAAVGDSSTFAAFGTPYCGKGEPNQIIRVGHASPAALFKNVDVFGGAA